MAQRKPKGNGRNIGPARELKDLVDRIVAVEIERKQVDAEFKSDIADLSTEAESKGYDPKALKIAVRRRHESAKARAKRLETDALADLYAAAIGDLNGKPLDELTRRRIDEQMRRANPEAEQPQSDQIDAPPEMTEPAAPPETSEQAHDKGKQARKEGKRIVENPYHSASPLRAAWDEGWCEEDGSDGMEIPAAWRREKPPGADDKDDLPPPAPGNDDDKKPEA